MLLESVLRASVRRSRRLDRLRSATGSWNCATCAGSTHSAARARGQPFVGASHATATTGTAQRARDGRGRRAQPLVGLLARGRSDTGAPLMTQGPYSARRVLQDDGQFRRDDRERTDGSGTHVEGCARLPVIALRCASHRTLPHAARSRVTPARARGRPEQGPAIGAMTIAVQPFGGTSCPEGATEPRQVVRGRGRAGTVPGRHMDGR